MQQQIIHADMVDDVLVPAPTGATEIVVAYNQEAGDCKTATIAFLGETRAVVTFDESGGRVVSHLGLGIDDSMQMQQSVENIIQVL